MGNRKERLALLQFGLRDAVALTVAFALMFFAVMPRYPSAHTITMQRALNEINRGNVVKGEYYQDYKYAYLQLLKPISDGNGKAVNTVSVDDPDRKLVSALESATVPSAHHGPRPLLALLGIGTGIILIVAVLYNVFARIRRPQLVREGGS